MGSENASEFDLGSTLRMSRAITPTSLTGGSAAHETIINKSPQPERNQKRRLSMCNANPLSNQCWPRTMKMLFLALTTLLMAMTVQAAAPIGQTIWLRAAANGRYVSADQNRGAFAPLVADRTSVSGWEQFQIIDAGGGYIAWRSVGNGRFVSADLNRGTYAPLVADRTSASTWEHFIWADLSGGSFTLRGRVTNRIVSADLNRGTFA